MEIWRLCRGGMGELIHLPDEGGINDQGAWMMEAFLILNEAYSRLKDRGQ